MELDMMMSAIGRAALEAREGVRLTSYRDSKGIWTIGVGHTASCGAPVPGPGVTITAAEADAAFARDLAIFEAAITKALKVPVADHEFDAIGSLAFNVGAGGAANSTVVRKLNAGDRAGAAAAFLLWNKPAEIVDRRRGEMDQFLTPYATALPKARRSDARPVKGVAAPAAPAPPLVLGSPPKPTAVQAPIEAAPQPAPSGGLFHAFLRGLAAISQRSA